MHTVEQAADALNLSEASIISLLRTHDPETGTTRLTRWQPDLDPAAFATAGMGGRTISPPAGQSAGGGAR